MTKTVSVQVQNQKRDLDVSDGACSPGGPWCVGMIAMLDADSPNGIQGASAVNLKTGAMRLVVGHPARIEGQKKTKIMVLSFCPCCGAKLTPAEAAP